MVLDQHIFRHKLHGYADQFVEFDLNCTTVAAMLDQKHGQESQNRRGCIDDELPRIRVAEAWPRDGPKMVSQHVPEQRDSRPLEILPVERYRNLDRCQICQGHLPLLRSSEEQGYPIWMPMPP